MIKRVLLVFFIITLGGCAARNVGHDRQDMTPYVADHCFVLDAPFTYSEKRGLGYRWEQGLLQGQYRAALQDEDGYYFLGPDGAVCQANPECEEFGTGFGGDGGVWVSKQSDDDLRLFVVQLPQDTSDIARDFGVLISALVRSEAGKIYIFDRNDEFVAAMTNRRTECPPE